MALRPIVESPVLTEQMKYNGQDQSQDANFALMELEKGLRSTKSGEQCEAIVNVPGLLEKYPFPILVNSAFLKLGDVFRTGSNFMKLCVLKAIQSSKKHLEKIFNVDEFCRRFFTVIHSNDPIARAVTLRVFGNISSIISERKNIHHCIRTSLDSHDTVEVEAAIYATKCFAEQSSNFASGIWQKVADMIQGLTTPIEMKLKLLPVFKFMCHDVNIAGEVNVICTNLLSIYPVHHFVGTILNTMTELALATLINIPHHINIILKYLTDDPRKSINLIAVKNLLLLAQKAPHLWDREHLDGLVCATMNCLHDVIKQKILMVVVLLSSEANCGNVFSEEVLQKLEDLMGDMCIEISTLALKARVFAVCSARDAIGPDILLALQSDIQMMTALSLSENSLVSLKRCMASAKVVLSKDSTISDLLISFIIECASSTGGCFLLEILHTLVSVSTFKQGFCRPHIDSLFGLFESRVYVTNDETDKNVLVALLTLILQSSSGRSLEEKIIVQERLLHHVSVLNAAEDYWTVFKMARQASRLAYPVFSSKLFNLLTSKVSSENLYFWLKALTKFQEAESSLMYEAQSVSKLQEMLMAAHNFYQEGLTNLKAAVTTDHPLYFQFKYCRLRADMLRAYSQLLTSCSSLKLNPPPALARAAAISNGMEVHHMSRIGVQFQNCALLFNNTALGFQNLYKSSFNSDDVTLRNILLLQESCQLVAYAIEMFVSQRRSERVSPECSSSCVTKQLNQHLQSITDTNLNVLKVIRDVDNRTKEENLSHQQTNCLTSIVLSQLKVGFSLPLYFFKSLQNTSIQLSVSPGNSHREDPHLVNIASEMTLKIEGVILEKSKSVNFRHVSKVNLTVRMKPSHTVRNVAYDIKPVQMTEMVLEESTEPLHEYFSAQFLLSFKYLGHHTVRISTGITDEHGVNWESGPSCTIHIDVYEHGGHLKKK
ncbi:integrator complex subunit 7-like [Hydractinia symbiolongicarpus]|uniref:integrator complex subunit 7-like n=1 Tax=Hydractinia symbiolongicarpus TaxID=13093 RepID=UPI002551251A|nr:integrator complex subunit 7-like [Hydractinia symbiolongicarpus]